ncbi:hypothetical protein Cgig2_025351 [Carnegiea gigantea]|uniref:Uncharacterized protein n=1 Tax=Carnegiea gigantea TaxID=171969 RepID=A0A9Q1GGX1_9CARY|nr:hypothetical protein Cgig2_025351 [Carnegiea gigantea]
MAFPRSLDTKATSEFVIRRFSWDRREKAFPPSPLPKDFRTLCPDFDLAVAEQAAEYYELPELPQVIFYAMLLNEAEKLGVLHGLRLLSLEFRPKSGSDEGTRADRQGESSSEGATADDAAPKGMAFPPIRNTREMADYVRETFIWRWRSVSRPSHPLPEDFNVLCPSLSLADAEAAAAKFELPEIVQATFYAILLNETFELDVAHEYTAERMKSSLVCLRWSTFEVWMHIMDEVIRGAQLYRPPDEMDVQDA